MKEEISRSLTYLKKGQIILYPTDTVWGIGCDATNYEAVKKIYNLKKRDDSKSMICLVNSFEMLQRYIERVPEVAFDILKNAINPTTIIYDKPKHVAENLIADDNTLAIRVVRHQFCSELIKKLGRPLVSTSANISGQKTPKSRKEISDEILKGVDYIVNLHDGKKTQNPSSIIKLGNDGTVKIIR